VLSQYPNGKTVIILDNARIHHEKLLKEFLEENKECLELVYLPPYNLNLNKIDELWEWLKDSVINNVFFHSREEIQKAEQKFIGWVNTVLQMVIDCLSL
jgi:transposase